MYSGSEVVSRDMDSLLSSSNFKYSSPGEFAKSKEMINSDLYYYYNNNNHHLQQQPPPPSPPPRHQQQQSSNLARYRSAPSSFVASLLNDDYPNRETSNSESEMMFPRFNDSNEYKVGINLKQEMEELVADYSVTEMVYATPALNHTSPASANSLSGLNSSIEMESLNQVKKSSGGNRSNLIRQSSSPAGFLSNLANENGFSVTSDVGNFRATNRTIMNKNGPVPRSRFMPQIIESENSETSNHQNGHLGNEQNGDESNRHYFPVMPNDSTFSSLKRNRDGEVNMFSNSNGFNTQNGDSKHYTSGLLHQMSLPSTSAEMSTIENLLHFQQDSVPFKIRAKRGFATHPRSIAERVRRTRISERMKKLQDLFPNMDKQANTADMLDLAVGYIKDLQKEVQTLNETRARCTCSSKR